MTHPATLTRRTVLAGAAGAAGAALAATTAPPVAALTVPSTRVPTRREQRRVVIVGSGFGGAVAALRLTRAGVPVTLLEQGRRWTSGPDGTTFPTVRTLDKRALFYGSAPSLFGRPLSPAPYAGLFNAEVSPHMTVMSGCGYGGGSLTYQGMTLEPSRAVFEHEFPAAIGYDEMHQVHYPEVRRMLGLQTAPDELIASPTYQAARVFKAKAEAAGYDVEKIPMPIDWSWALRELRGEMAPSYTNGDCALGVNNGGKHSLDHTYLREAEATGLLDVRLLHRVTDIARTPDGTWRVDVARTDVRGTTLEHQVITTSALVLGAGSGGTTKMLVRAGATGAIPDLPDAVGAGWGTNADRIYVWSSLADDFGATQGGPVVYGSLDWSDPARANTVIQASIPPVLVLGDQQVPLGSTIMVGYGVSRARGVFRYDPLRDAAVLDWGREADAEIQLTRIGPRTARIAGVGGVLLDTNAVVPSTWHPMGGANVGEVCDPSGRVLGQRGLYVVDGAFLPGSAAACNPSMTIAALAERSLSRLVPEDVGSVI